MILNLDALGDKLLVGNDAGWALTLHPQPDMKVDEEPTLMLSREHYNAEIEAVLPSGLAGGSYTIAIEGLTDKDYSTVRNGDNRGPPTVARLYLYWRDVNTSVAGYLANAAGLTDFLSPPSGDALRSALVAELWIKEVARKRGTRRYDAVLTCMERAFWALTAQRLTGPRGIVEPTIPDALRRIEEHAGMKPRALLAPEGFRPDDKLSLATTGEHPPSQSVEIPVGTSYRLALAKIGERIEQLTGKRGRGMLLIRDGKLHVGPRAIPLQGEPKRLTPAGGLLAITAGEPVPRDPNLTGEDLVDQAGRPPSRPTFTVTCKGRPDVKPGDVVAVNLPPEDAPHLNPPVGAALLGQLAGPLLPALGGGANPTLLYVSSVKHRLARATGFSSAITGVAIISGDEAWDSWTSGASRENADAQDPAHGAHDAADPAGQAAGAIHALIRRDSETRFHPEIGQVRLATAKQETPDGPPSRTETVWRGLVPPDGGSRGGHRLPVNSDTPSPLPGVPQASPFAWGRCGLVLPRYPGTRVLLVHRNGDPDDAVDVGAVWEAGHGPDAEPGDWWLILPVAVPAGDRLSVADSATPQEHTSKVTDDLIDADGNRVIQVGELTIRVTRDRLSEAGKRPPRADDKDSVTIEHVEGKSRIVITGDGKVTIHAHANLELESDKDVVIKGNNVKVNVSGTMDVS
jgi:hypothetical protein